MLQAPTAEDGTIDPKAQAHPHPAPRPVAHLSSERGCRCRGNRAGTQPWSSQCGEGGWARCAHVALSCRPGTAACEDVFTRSPRSGRS